MNEGFTLLWGSLVNSSVWGLPDHVRLVWVTMLALKDRYGVVRGSVPGLAHQARVEVEKTREALEVLKAPDLDSSGREYEGRRIEEVDGGWVILNHFKYRGSERDTREYWRVRKQMQRDREKAMRDGKRRRFEKVVTGGVPSLAEKLAVKAEAYET